MKYLIPVLALLSACAETKSWQEACFKTVSSPQQGLLGGARAPVYDPTLTVRRHGGQELIYCDG